MIHEEINTGLEIRDGDENEEPDQPENGGGEEDILNITNVSTSDQTEITSNVRIVENAQNMSPMNTSPNTRYYLRARRERDHSHHLHFYP
jgi:hypothetical protein